MKRLSILLVVAVCAVALFYSSSAPKLPKPAREVPAEVCLSRAAELASFACSMNPRSAPSKDELSWAVQVRAEIFGLLPAVQGSDLDDSVRVFAQKVLGRPVTADQLIDVNASGMQVAGTVKGHSVSHSNDTVYFVLDHEGKRELVVKAFVGSDQKRSLFLPQLAALHVLGKLPLTQSDPMRALALARCEAEGSNYALMAMAVSPGRMISQVLREVSAAPAGSPERSAAMTRAEKSVTALAHALAELHNQGSGASVHLSDRDLYIQEVRKLSRAIAPIFANHERVSPVLFTQLIDRAVKDALTEKLTLSYVHGGMNLKNALYDADTNRITFIDTVYTARSIDRFGQPASFGFVDYSKFTKELMALDSDAFTHDESKALVAAFSKAYLSNAHVPPAVLRLVEIRNHMREMEEFVIAGTWEELYRRGHNYFSSQL